MTTYLKGLWPVRRDERGLALLLYGLLTLMVLADWIGKVGTNSLFVKRVGVQFIPAMYVATPVVLLLTSMALFALVDRLRRRTLLVGYVAAVAALSFALQLALPLGSVAYTIGYVFTHIVKETIYLIFWVYTGNLYDTEQSKRIFPLFAGALLVGKIAGGVASTGLAETIHSENFLAAQGVGFLICLLVLALSLHRLPAGEDTAVPLKQRPSGLTAGIRDSLEGYRAVVSDRLLRPFGASVFLWYFLMQIGNYLYLVGLDTSTAVGTAQQKEDAFSQLYASVYTSGSLAALLIQTVLTGAVLRRFGVSAALFVFPLWYTMAYGSALVAFTFVTAVLIQLGERVVVPAIHLPATQVVYSQVRAELRPRARAFLSGGVNAVGNMAAALVLIAGAAIASAAAILALASAFSLVFVANTWALRGALGRRIAENLTSPDAELRRNAAQMLHGEGRAVPAQALFAVLDAPHADVEETVRSALLRRGFAEATAE